MAEIATPTANASPYLMDIPAPTEKPPKALPSTNPTTFSPSFKDLIIGMLAFQPYERATLADIVFHPWFTDNQNKSC